MEAYETFVSEPSQLPEVMDELRMMGMPEQFDKQWLYQLPTEQPVSDLYMHLFKRIGLINEDGEPIDEHYSKFVESSEASRALIGKLVQSSYEEIFNRNPKAHKLSVEELEEIFQELIGDRKSETVINMVAQTFKGLVDYAYHGSGDTQSTNKEVAFSMEQEAESLEKMDMNINGHTSNGKDHTSEEEDSHSDEQDHSLEAIPQDSTSQSVPTNSSRSASEPTTTTQSAPTADSQNAMKTPSVSEQASEKAKYLKKALLRRARLYEKLEKFDQAAKAYRDIVVHAKKGKFHFSEEVMTEAYFKSASLLEEQERLEDAVDMYEQFIQEYGAFARNQSQNA